MTMTDQSSGAAHWVRADEPARGLWPGAVLPALVLLAACVYAFVWLAPQLQNQVNRSAAATLVAAGLSTDAIATDGREVVVEATLQASEDVSRFTNGVASAVRGSLCDTWAGELSCGAGVDVAVKQAAAPVVTPEPVVERLPEAKTWDFVLNRLEDTLTLTGDLPADVGWQEVNAAAGRRFGVVDNRLTESEAVGDDVAVGIYRQALDKGLGIVSLLSQGQVVWGDGQLQVQGLVTQAQQPQLNDLLVSIEQGNGSLESPFPYLGYIDVSLAQDSRTCDAQFGNVLSQTTIRFGSASADIDPASLPLLESLAQVATSCPGLLVVEGHTDSTGNTFGNDLLSEDRALAVVQALADLGVDERRLKAVGLGSSQPIADNGTAQGRAQNRRIVVRTATDLDKENV